jgi:NTP pyrophosphatase (non-canonical NTP hydrolase)
MVNLYECVQYIRDLVKEKGFEDECTDKVLFGKGLFAIMELSEAMEIIKKHGVETLKVSKHAREEVQEELIDSIFYLLDLYGLLQRDIPLEVPDKVFMDKLKKNKQRNFQYGRPELVEYKSEKK